MVESEGNGRMCVTLPETLITVMGIEKILPAFTDLEVFLQLLPRSSTGERMNPYTSLWTGVTPGDGPQNFHIVLLDNGRTNALADQVGRAALHCIRCSACLNVCPVYERTGGHAYGSVYPGPIGAVLTPQLTGMHGHHDVNSTLPYASSLCGACLRRLPGEDRHPDAAGRAARPGGGLRSGPHHPRRLGRGDEGRVLGDERPQTVRRRREGPGGRPARRRQGPARSSTCPPRVGLDAQQGPAGPAEADVPAVVGADPWGGGQ